MHRDLCLRGHSGIDFPTESYIMGRWVSPFHSHEKEVFCGEHSGHA
jgi:hypothetical protein